MRAAGAVPRRHALGVLLPSAEELGLAGARAWARTRPAAVAINCDGVDDDGATTVMYTRRRPARLLDAAARAGAALHEAVRARRLLPGILTDGVALADAGWEVVTVSRGGLGTLARIHTPADRPDRLTASGVARTAQLIARMVVALAAAEAGDGADRGHAPAAAGAPRPAGSPRHARTLTP
jgi:hypothetical protein